MTFRVLCVKHFKEKSCFSVIFTDGSSYDTEKMRTYGLIPVEKFCRDISLLNDAIDSVGHDVKFEFDYRGNISSINPA